VVAFVESSVIWHARHHTVARIIQYELGALGPEDFAETRRLRRRYEKLLRQELQRGQADQSITRAIDADAAALALLSLGIDVARWYRSGVDASPERLGTAYGELAFRMLSATTS
jgi:hypothetical protein